MNTNQMINNPKKRVKEVKKENFIELKTIETKSKGGSYVRISSDEKTEKLNEFQKKVNNGELKFAFYGIDNDKGYFNYQKI